MTLETKKTDTVRVDLSEYYYIIVFDEYFCKACYKNLSDEKILMIYNKKGLDKIDRISLYNSIKKIYKSADIYFVCTTLPKDFKINRITKYDNGKQKISLSKIY
ncbi:MAG: hypothetical protein ACTTJH_06725 [Bacteroidales bacterium]